MIAPIRALPFDRSANKESTYHTHLGINSKDVKKPNCIHEAVLDWPRRRKAWRDDFAIYLHEQLREQGIMLHSQYGMKEADEEHHMLREERKCEA